MTLQAEAMKEHFNYALSRHPILYSKLLRLRRHSNLEKILFLNLIRDGDVVFDIGANRGYYTILFSHLVGSTGRVHAFEPSPSTFERLSRAVSVAQRFDNIHLNDLGAADFNGEANLYTPDYDDGQASLVIQGKGSWENPARIHTYRCKILRLDDYVDSKLMQRLDFIKCDIEGAELPALRGMAKTISTFRPLIHLEVCRDWTGSFNYEPREIVDYLSAFGYASFHLVDTGIRFLSSPDSDLAPTNLSGSANMLCSIPDRHRLRTDRLMSAYAGSGHEGAGGT